MEKLGAAWFGGITALPQEGLWVNRRFRLRKTSDILRVRRDGKSYAHPLVVLQFNENQLEQTRIAVIASRKIGNAVKRNRARRLLREASRKFYPEIQTGWDILLTARSPITKAHYPAVEAALQNLFNKADLLVALNVR